jgi:hypothetical protein
MPVINLNPWSYEYIRKMAEEATILARQEGLRPVLATEVVTTYKRNHRLNIPNLGDHIPEGWKRIDHLIEPVFVDITGRVRPGESNAITAFEFSKRAEQHTKGESSFVVGYGVIEMGQTQALVATYRKEADGNSQNKT